MKGFNSLSLSLSTRFRFQVIRDEPAWTKIVSVSCNHELISMFFYKPYTKPHSILLLYCSPFPASEGTLFILITPSIYITWLFLLHIWKHNIPWSVYPTGIRTTLSIIHIQTEITSPFSNNHFSCWKRNHCLLRYTHSHVYTLKVALFNHPITVFT